jgi:aspartyl-tRNA synthetase
VARFIDELKRTHLCGALRETDVGREVVLFGWVQNRRDHGGLIFIDLRDRDGTTQIVFDPGADAAAFEVGDKARPEWVLGIRGDVRDRGAMRNPKLATGSIEVVVREACVFNKSETPPFEISDSIDTAEEKRLAYRYLDLRRPRLQRNLMLRSRLNHAARSYLSENGFTEVETPFLVKYTPGGARNFLVPSRQQSGKFFALAESPQLFKPTATTRPPAARVAWMASTVEAGMSKRSGRGSAASSVASPVEDSPAACVREAKRTPRRRSSSSNVQVRGSPAEGGSAAQGRAA